jgi:catechol 2,3-dioxygenase-like lactoylglutathione lyase family enzyme
MIRVRRIGHATFESPDVERLTDYYRQVLGLALVAWNAGAIHLARTLDNHSVVLRHGP